LDKVPGWLLAVGSCGDYWQSRGWKSVKIMDAKKNVHKEGYNYEYRRLLQKDAGK